MDLQRALAPGISGALICRVNLDRGDDTGSGNTEHLDLDSLRPGEVGLDIVAALPIVAVLVFSKYLEAAVVAPMCSVATFLESYAEGLARPEMYDPLLWSPCLDRRFRYRQRSRDPADLRQY